MKRTLTLSAAFLAFSLVLHGATSALAQQAPAAGKASATSKTASKPGATKSVVNLSLIHI